MAIAFVICNMDKVNMSVAIIPMAEQLGLSATDRGLISSAFFWGYSLTQLPAGWISTKIGGAKVLLAAVALWSLGTALAVPTAQSSFTLLCLSRMLVGLGEGLSPAAATHVMANVVPASERSSAVTTVFGGLDVGSAAGVLIVAPIIDHYGWPAGFTSFAVLGFVWCTLWPLLHPDLKPLGFPAQKPTNPAQPPPDALAAAPGSSAATTAITTTTTTTTITTSAGSDSMPVPWMEFLRSRPVWAINVAHFANNWGHYTLLAWLPSYYQLGLGLDVEAASLLTLIPYLAMIAMNNVVGRVGDGLVSRGMPLTRVRKLCQNVAFLVPAACMLALAALSPSGEAASHEGVSASGAPIPVLVAVMSMAFGFSAWARAGLYCNHQDLSPKYASALLGISNTFGAFPGVLGVMAAGWLFDHTGNWGVALFLPTAACQVVGAAVYTVYASSERQPWS